MALVVFRSRAASEIVMLPDTAQRLLELMGRSMAERGVITHGQINDALTRLQEAVEQEKKSDAPRSNDDDPPGTHPVSLRQRAYPLLEMLRAAHKQGVDVTWGI
jgi:hypothetical protein